MSFIPIQLLRNSTLGHRPSLSDLLPGQPAVNTNALQPGLFFEDSTGNSLIKIGPTTVGLNPPTMTPSLGESWLQPEGSAPGIPMFWVFDGSNWKGVPLTATYVAP